MRALYHNAFIPYAVYGLISYSFIYSYADAFIPFLFGSKYTDTSFFCKEMFLTMIIFPTTFLQANVLITMKLEKLDMLCNVVSLVLNILFCIVGFIYFQKSLSVVNYAIFFSLYSLSYNTGRCINKKRHYFINARTFILRWLCGNCIFLPVTG